MLLGVPLVVRLVTSRADWIISKEVSGLSFGSSIPGGFSGARLNLYRPLSIDPDDVRRYGKLYIYDGRSGETLWQGRLEDPGRSSELWEIVAVGASAHARDRTMPVIYVDQSLGRWVRYSDSLAHPDATDRVQEDQGGSGLPALHLMFGRGNVLVTNNFVGRKYRAIREAGQKLARIGYTWDAGQTVGDIFTQLTLRASGTQASTVAFNVAGGSVATVVITNFPNGDDLCELRVVYTGAGGEIVNHLAWSSIRSLYVMAMRFNKDGTEKTTGYTTATVLASDIVADLLGRLLPKYDRANANVAVTSYAIEQLAYPDGTTAEKILADLMLMHPDHFWAAWAGDLAEFEWRAWPTTVELEADAKDGFTSPSSSAELFNECRVRWLDLFGLPQVNVRTNAVQELTDAGLTRTAFIDLSDNVGGSLNADRAGDQFLLEHVTATNAGTLSVRRPIFDRTRGMAIDPWELPRRAPGKLISVRDVFPRVDALNPTARDAVTTFKVVGADYDAASNTCTLSLDSHPKVLTRLLSRMTIPQYNEARIR